MTSTSFGWIQNTESGAKPDFWLKRYSRMVSIAAATQHALYGIQDNAFYQLWVHHLSEQVL